MSLLDWVIKTSNKIADNFNQHKFFIKHQPQLITSSSIVSIFTYVSRQMSATIPCRFKWSKIRNGLVSQMPQFKGNTYICEPSDIGSYLEVEITSTDMQHSGCAILKLGPVKMDVLLKKQIQISLSTGQCCFYVDLIYNSMYNNNNNNNNNKNNNINNNHNDNHNININNNNTNNNHMNRYNNTYTANNYHNNNKECKQCVMKITQDKISLIHMNSQTIYTFQHSLIEPKIQIVSKDPLKILILFNEKYHQELRKFIIRLFQSQLSIQYQQQHLSSYNNIFKHSYLQLNFSNRKSRDSFLYIIKGFNTRRQLKSSVIINRLQKAQHLFISQSPQFDYLYQIQSLKSDILKLLQINGKNIKQKQVIKEENYKLQMEIQNIIREYTEIIQNKFKNVGEFQKSFAYLKDKKEEVYMKQLQKQNNQLRMKLNMQLNYNQHNNIKQLNEYNQTNNPILHHKTLPKQQPFQLILSNINQSFRQQQPPTNNRILIKKLNQSIRKIQYLQKQLQQYQNKSSINIYGNIKNNQDEDDMKKSNRSYNNKGSNNKNNVNGNDNGKNQENKLFHTFNKQKNNYQRVIILDSNKNNNNISSNKNKKNNYNNKYINNNNNNDNNNNNNNDNMNEFDNIQLKSIKMSSPSINSYQKQLSHSNMNMNNFSKIVSSLQFSSLQQQNNYLKSFIFSLQQLLNKCKKQGIEKQQKYKKKLSQLSQQLSLYRRNNDILNRSQHLSLQMDQYQQQQQNIIKNQNNLLRNQNQKLTILCEKYMIDAKKYKMLKKQLQTKGINMSIRSMELLEK